MSHLQMFSCCVGSRPIFGKKRVVNPGSKTGYRKVHKNIADRSETSLHFGGEDEEEDNRKTKF